VTVKAVLLCVTFLAVVPSLSAVAFDAALDSAEVRWFPSEGGDPDEPMIAAAAESLRSAGRLLDGDAVREQLSRTKCELTLPPVRTVKLSGRDVWRAARSSHFRVGWYCLCMTCDRWHVRLSGGYAISADGGVATCEHIVRFDDTSMREGYLVAADDDGRTYSVTEVLAVNSAADVAIVRIDVDETSPLPLNTDTKPGDIVWCYSEPLGLRGYFSQGIVNRFVSKDGGDGEVTSGINVSVDWKVGSSGAALLDDCGNAVGHVSTVSLRRDESPGRPRLGEALMIHEAASAFEVLKLVHPKP
jgi:hypothetical protein